MFYKLTSEELLKKIFDKSGKEDSFNGHVDIKIGDIYSEVIKLLEDTKKQRYTKAELLAEFTSIHFPFRFTYTGETVDQRLDIDIKIPLRENLN